MEFICEKSLLKASTGSEKLKAPFLNVIGAKFPKNPAVVSLVYLDTSFGMLLRRLATTFRKTSFLVDVGVTHLAKKFCMATSFKS